MVKMATESYTYVDELPDYVLQKIGKAVDYYTKKNKYNSTANELYDNIVNSKIKDVIGNDDDDLSKAVDKILKPYVESANRTGSYIVNCYSDGIEVDTYSDYDSEDDAVRYAEYCYNTGDFDEVRVCNTDNNECIYVWEDSNVYTEAKGNVIPKNWKKITFEYADDDLKKRYGSGTLELIHDEKYDGKPVLVDANGHHWHPNWNMLRTPELVKILDIETYDGNESRTEKIYGVDCKVTRVKCGTGRMCDQYEFTIPGWGTSKIIGRKDAERVINARISNPEFAELHNTKYESIGNNNSYIVKCYSNGTDMDTAEFSYEEDAVRYAKFMYQDDVYDYDEVRVYNGDTNECLYVWEDNMLDESVLGDTEDDYYGESDWYDYNPDDVELDREHTNLYGGDPMYCYDCGSKLKYGEDGYSYCPNCSMEDLELSESVEDIQFVKLNDEPIEIEYGDNDNYVFTFDGQTYDLNDFIRTHDNAWAKYDVPDYIHGVYAYDYSNPIWIELVDNRDDYVNVYRQVTSVDEGCGKKSKKKRVKKESAEELKDYEIVVQFAGSLVCEQEYNVSAFSLDEAINYAMEEAYEDLSVEDIDGNEEDGFEVTINFCGYIGGEETYNVYADDESEAEEDAMDQAMMELNIISVNGQDYDYDNPIEEFCGKKKSKYKKVKKESIIKQNDKYVLFNDIGGYKVTEIDNYNKRISNANKNRRVDASTDEEAIEIFDRYFSESNKKVKKESTDTKWFSSEIMVDERELKDKLLRFLKQHKIKFEVSGLDGEVNGKADFLGWHIEINCTPEQAQAIDDMIDKGEFE